MKYIKILALPLLIVLVSLGIYYYLVILDDKSVEVVEFKVSKNSNTKQDNVNIKNNIDKEKLAEEVVIRKISGNFIKIDAVHYGSGDVEVTDRGEFYNIKFNDNFTSANGPDLYVYLSNQENVKNIAVGAIDTAKSINIGKLKSQSGAQEYNIAKKDFEAHDKSIIIWCKQFAVQFSRADLK
jgi:Electron transfer DM13